MKYVRTSEDFDALVASGDPRVANLHPYIFDEEDWTVVLFLLKNRFDLVGTEDKWEQTIRGTVTRLLESRPKILERYHTGKPVDFHTVDRILEATYKKIFGAISVGANTLPEEQRTRRRAPVPARSNIDWQGRPLA